MKKAIRQFIQKATTDLLDNDIQIKLVNTAENLGEFDDRKRVFLCRITKDVDEWFPVFVHEYCHFLQRKDNKYISDCWLNSLDKLDEWAKGNASFSPRALKRLAGKARLIELDCEKRTVGLIIKYQLPIDITKYIKEANADLFSYSFIGEGNKNICRGMLSGVQEIVELMPSHFLSRYDRIPDKIREVAKPHLERDT